MRIDIITVLPEMLEGFFNCSIMSRAQKKGLAEIHIHNLRDYAYDRYRKVDDYPFGGFAGMVMKIEPIDRCISALKAEREYDEAGNKFLQDEIGDIIFTFSLEDAIEKGILCEFDYIPLPYVLTEEEKAKKKKIIAAFNAQKEAGEPVDEKDMFTKLSRINKIAINKIDEFEAFISTDPSLLEKSTLLTSIFSCQVISNVPSSILLSQFTENYADLLVGVNIGGTFTSPKISVDVKNAVKDVAKGLLNEKLGNILGSSNNNTSTSNSDSQGSSTDAVEQARAAGQKLVDAAKAQRDSLVNKANSKLAKIAAQTAGDALVKKAEQNAEKMVKEAEAKAAQK